MKFREGPIGALMDEYERATNEYKQVIISLSEERYQQILDAVTEDEDCRSVESITNHVIRAGYGYANYIRKQFNQPLQSRKDVYDVPDPATAGVELEKMLAYTIETLEKLPDLSLEDILQNIIKTTWQQQYDFEQLVEHSIVHLLRHRRQIQKLLEKSASK